MTEWGTDEDLLQYTVVELQQLLDKCLDDAQLEQVRPDCSTLTPVHMVHCYLYSKKVQLVIDHAA